MPEPALLNEPARVKQIQQDRISLEMLERVHNLNVKDGDILIFRAPHELQPEALATGQQLCAAIEMHHPTVKVILLPPGWNLEKVDEGTLASLGLRRIVPVLPGVVAPPTVSG